MPDVATLSTIRQKIINTILPMVCESTYPSPKFNMMMHEGPTSTGYLKPIRDSFPTYTTCVELPGFVGGQLGETGWSGLTNCRKLGRENDPNCWVDFTGSERPEPGDIYALLPAGVTSVNPKSLFVHIGVIKEIKENGIWITADAGQGLWPVQQVLYVQRKFDPAKGTLSSDLMRPNGEPPRRIGGWLNIEKYFDPYAEPDDIYG